jgi:hypothetical protein
MKKKEEEEKAQAGRKVADSQTLQAFEFRHPMHQYLLA